jgi:hypothetical protein
MTDQVDFLIQVLRASSDLKPYGMIGARRQAARSVEVAKASGDDEALRLWSAVVEALQPRQNPT